MDLMNDLIRPQSPVHPRPHAILVCRPSIEPRPSTRQCREIEIRTFRLEIVVFQMPHMDVAIGRSFLHQWRLF
jgi:hypothetical protein